MGRCHLVSADHLQLRLDAEVGDTEASVGMGVIDQLRILFQYARSVGAVDQAAKAGQRVRSGPDASVTLKAASV